MTADTLRSSPETLAPRFDQYTIKPGEGKSAIATNLGIRASFLPDLEKDAALRSGDMFGLSVDNAGKGMLTKSRTGKDGVQNILARFELSREAIYQNIELDRGFSGIKYVRLPGAQKYQMIFSDGSLPSGEPVFISTVNFDNFRAELEKVSGKFVTECSSRILQHELSCSIQSVKSFAQTVRLNSSNPLDLIPTQVDLGALIKFLGGKIDSLRLGKILAQSLNI